MISVAGINYGSKVQSFHEDRISKMIENSIDLEHKLQDKVNELLDLQRTLDNAIDSSEGNSDREKALLRNHFINGLSWEECAKLMNFDVRHIHRLKKKALDNFTIPAKTNNERTKACT